jgi:UDP-2,4-diacetamido-2,4,6-trideoxy-beta-L-altropyranose hydrolase
MIVVFRADASLEIGSGHVMRCLTLADELKMNGHQCHFIVRRQPGSLELLIEEREYGVHVLGECHESEVISEEYGQDDLAHAHWLKGGWRKDAAEVVAILDSLKPHWLIIDHYGIDHRWERSLAGHCRYLMVIDDIADRIHHCDLLLDQNLGRHDSDYVLLVPQSCKVLTGPRYALLRSEFRKFRDYSLKRRKSAELRHILVNMGGVDQPNLTEDVLVALTKIPLPADTQITVVMGRNAPWVKEITLRAESFPRRTQVLVGVNNMAEIMAEADLAIGAAGSTSWERCCLGLPSIMIVLADNQRLIARSLEANGAASALKCSQAEAELGGLVSRFILAPQWLRQMSAGAATIVDGEGCPRLINELIVR